MKINTALILSAGFGKRLNPITLKIPKPLIRIKNIELLEYNLNLIKSLDINNIKINTFYLEDQIEKFISKHPLKKKIEIIKDGNKILDTGGGILNLIKNSSDKDFLIFNSDTIWGPKYKDTINNMVKIYFKNKMQNLLMVVDKANSYDTRFKGDFQIKENKLSKEIECNYIYTGCQLINRNLFENMKIDTFSVSKIWYKQMDKKELYGYEYKGKFIHLTDFEIYKRLTQE